MDVGRGRHVRAARPPADGRRGLPVQRLHRRRRSRAARGRRQRAHSRRRVRRTRGRGVRLVDRRTRSLLVAGSDRRRTSQTRADRPGLDDRVPGPRDGRDVGIGAARRRRGRAADRARPGGRAAERPRRDHGRAGVERARCRPVRPGRRDGLRQAAARPDGTRRASRLAGARCRPCTGSSIPGCR